MTMMKKLAAISALFLACMTILSAAPLAPFNLTATVNGSTVRLSWVGTAGAIAYRVEAGSASGLSDLAVITVDTPALLAAGVGNGTYYVRVRALGSDGLSAASNEVRLVVGCMEPPVTPMMVSWQVIGYQVTFTWRDGGECAPSGHSLVVGSRPGARDLGTIPTGVPTSPLTVSAPDGVYYVSLVATNTNGSSAPTPELTIRVPYFAPPPPPPLPPLPPPLPPLPPPPPTPVWTVSGSSDDVVDIPASVARIRISARLVAGSSLGNFSVRVDGTLLVIVTLTAARPTYSGTHVITDGGVAVIEGPNTMWTLTEVRPAS